MPAPELSRRELLGGAAAAGMLASGVVGSAKTPKDSSTAALDDDDRYLPVEDLHRQYLDYVTTKFYEIEEQREARQYYHGAHWTAQEAETLRKRGQPKITYNRIGRKINGIVGLIQRMRQDPKGFPRTPRNEEGAEVATATVRYVLDANDWRSTESNCLLKAGYEGLTGVELNLVSGDHGDPDISLSPIDGENIFYDPRSFKPDFSDARYLGIAKWVDLDEAIEMFPDKEEELRGLIETGSDLSTNTDREFKWILVREKRLRLVEHWYKHRSRWCWAFYVGFTLLQEGESPFFDERRKSISRFVMFSAAVDHDGDRYGFVRTLKGAQDEINHRRSKALHTSSSRQMEITKGAVDDVEVARRERVRPDGVIEKNPGGEINYLDNTADLAGQFQFLEEAKNEIAGFANTDIVGSMGPMAKNLSGRAINLLQQPGMAELGPFVDAYRSWKLKIYRAIFVMAQQHWTAERWIRVTDDENIPKFMQVNGMEIGEDGQPVIVNALGALDVDIILDEGPDVVNMMADTYDQLSQRQDVPFPILLELMPMQGSVKRKIQALLQQSQDPSQQIAKKLALAQAAAKVDQTQADAASKNATAVEKTARAVTDAARADHLRMEAHLAPIDFGLRAMKEAAAAQNAPAPDNGIPGQSAMLPPQQPPQPGMMGAS